MAFPDLELYPRAQYHAWAEGVPVNGNNLIKLPFKKEILLAIPSTLDLNVYPLGASVLNAEEVSVDLENGVVVINFTQTGADKARVEAVVRWSGSN